MTPADLIAARRTLGLTQTALAQALRLRGRGLRSVQRWEAPGGEVPGPVQVAVELMVNARRIYDAVMARHQELEQNVARIRSESAALGALKRGAAPILGERSREWVMPIKAKDDGQ